VADATNKLMMGMALPSSTPVSLSASQSAEASRQPLTIRVGLPILPLGDLDHHRFEDSEVP